MPDKQDSVTVRGACDKRGRVLATSAAPDLLLRLSRLGVDHGHGGGGVCTTRPPTRGAWWRRCRSGGTDALPACRGGWRRVLPRLRGGRPWPPRRGQRAGSMDALPRGRGLRGYKQCPRSEGKTGPRKKARDVREDLGVRAVDSVDGGGAGRWTRASM